MKFEYFDVHGSISGVMLAWWFATFVHGPAVIYAHAMSFSPKTTKKKKEEEKESSRMAP
jgi:hypothetical protein